MVTKQFKDIELSRLGMGNMRLPILPGGTAKDIDYEKAEAIIDYAYAHGINYYDSAYVYHAGESERFAGKALSKYPRDSYYITTKYNVHANADYEAVFKEQLERYNVDYIDFYLIHAVMESNINKYMSNGCINFFKEMKKQGKIKYLGFSSHASVENLKRFADCNKWDFAQIQLNYYDWNYGTAKEEYEALVERNIPIMVMESIRGGRLAQLTDEAEVLLKEAHPDWSTPSWGFRWLKRLDGVQVALSGMSNLEQIVDNVKTYEDDRALTDEEEAILFKACAIHAEKFKVPCTGCRYCTDDCPMEINIPEVLKVYNKYKVEGARGIPAAMRQVETKGQPKDCIGCGACAANCPQKIQIPDHMKELADVIYKNAHL